MKWASTPLVELVDARAGFASGESVDAGLAQVRMNNVTTDGRLDWSRLRRVPLPRKGTEGLLAQPGDVLFNATNSPELVGKSAYFSAFSEPLSYSNHFLRLRPKEGLDGKYLAHWLRDRWGARVFEGMCRAWVNQASVSKDQLLALEIPLPPFDEQRRIAAILDQADALRRKRREGLVKMAQLPKSLFYRTFGAPWSPQQSWPFALFGAVTDTKLGKMLDQGKFRGGPRRRYLRNANVRWFEFDLTDMLTMEISDNERSRFAVMPGDLLICEGGEPGRCAIWKGKEGEEIFYQKALHRCRVNPHKLVPEYAAYVLWSLAQAGALAGVTSATIAHLTAEKLTRLSIPIPPLDLQETFARQLAAIDEEVARLRRHLGHLDALFASLQHRAFTGQLTSSDERLLETA